MWEGGETTTNTTGGIATMPHHRMTKGQNRKAARLHEESLQLDENTTNAHEDSYVDDDMHEDHHMEEMIDHFYENRIPSTRQAGQTSRDNLEEEEDFLRENATTPLYEGCEYSILRASLELLNLQTIYGWSNASVDGLLRYVHQLCPLY